MKPYLETTRRLSRIALILLVLSVVSSIILTIQYCMNQYLNSIPSFSKMFLPQIIYMFVGGVVLALDGFSFLNKRSDSDFYHSLPISRKRFFWAITLAALTWLAATVLASVISTVLVFTVTRTPFVPTYVMLSVPFFVVGGMLVFAATSIAMMLTGTWISNIAMTLVVLGLPRFIQFVVARGLLARFSMMNWLDLPWYLSPVSNIATGQILSFTHSMVTVQLYQLPNIAYSLGLVVLELILARVLFVRRPSELAEHNAKSAKVQTLFACLTVFPVAILFASGAIKPTALNLLIVGAVIVAIYAIYQIVVFRNSQKVLRSMPWAAIPIALAVLLFYGIQIPFNAAKADIPMIQDVAYVSFPGSNRSNGGAAPYEEIQVSKIRFTDQELKNYVLTALRDNIASLNPHGYVSMDSYDSFSTYEPVTIGLNNGRTIRRILWFNSSNTLNALRDENPEYAEAIRALPPEDSICYLQSYDPYNPKYQDVKPIMEAYYDDIASTGYIPNWMYNQHSENEDFNLDGKQSYGSINLVGYVGDRRYTEYYDIRRETTNAATAWMSWHNEKSSDEFYDILKQIGAKADTFSSPEEYLNGNFTFYNVPATNGSKQTSNIYYNRSASDQTELNTPFAPVATELIEILSRSKPTTDPNSLNCYFSWSGRALDGKGSYIGAEEIAKQQASYGNAMASGDVLFTSWGNSMYYASDGSAIQYMSVGTVVSYNPCYRSFSAEDEARVIELLKQWQEIQREVQFNYNYGDGSGIVAPAETSVDHYIEATPTPAP